MRSGLFLFAHTDCAHAEVAKRVTVNVQAVVPGLLGYVGFSGLYGTALVAQVPIVIGFVGITISAVLQVVFANAAPKASRLNADCD